MAGFRDKELNVLTESLNMSAANVSTEKSINLGISTAERLVMEIHQVIFDHDSLEYPASANTETTMHIMLGTETGIDGSTHHLADEKILAAIEKVARLGNGANLTPTLEERWSVNNVYTPPEPILYPFNTLYLVMDTNGYGAAKGCRVKILYKWRKVSNAEYIELLEYYNSLI